MLLHPPQFISPQFLHGRTHAYPCPRLVLAQVEPGGQDWLQQGSFFLQEPHSPLTEQNWVPGQPLTEQDCVLPGVQLPTVPPQLVLPQEPDVLLQHDVPQQPVALPQHMFV
jgi:hypothetical protein